VFAELDLKALLELNYQPPFDDSEIGYYEEPVQDET